MIDYQKPEMAWLFLLTLIPVVIHFFIRSKTKKVPFPSVFFLKQAIQKKSQEIRFSQFLLLLLRILIFFILALILMQPFVKGRYFFSGISEGGTHYGILLDTSFSMNLNLSGESLFERSKQKLLEYLEFLHDEDRITLLSTDGQGSALSTPFEPLTAEKKELISRLSPGKEPADLLGCYKSMLSMMEKTGDTPKCLLILSDFQTSNSQSFLNYLSLSAPPFPVLFLLPEENFEKIPSNIYIKSTDIPYDSLIHPDNPHFEAVVASSGNKPVKATFNALIRSENIFKSAFDLNNSRYSLSIAYSQDTREQPLEILLSGDSFILDNTYYGILKNAHPYRILCINPPEEDPAFYLKKALLPNENRHSSDALPFLIDNVSTNELLPPMKKYDLVVASDPLLMPLQSFRSLQDYVIKGGGLILHFCNLFTLNQYQKILASTGNDEYPILPASPTPIPVIKDEPLLKKMALTEQSRKIFSSLSERISWDNAFAKTTMPFSFKKDLTFDSLIKSEKSSPLLIYKTLGKGKIACFTASLNPESSPFVGEKIFVPLVHQLFQALTRKKNTPLSFFTGDKIPVPASATRYVTPAGEDVRIEKEDSSFLIPAEPGFYRFYKDEDFISSFTANIPPSESLFEYSAIKKFKFKNSKACSIEKSDEIKHFLMNKNSKTPLWILLLWLITGLFLLENFILYRLRP